MSESNPAAPVAPTTASSSTPVEMPLARRLADAVAWIKARERTILIAAAAFQVLVLLAMMVRPATTLAVGRTVLVRTAPVDPRDLFRGDYVILSYEFSRLDPTKLEDVSSEAADATSRVGKTVYARLAPESDGQHWAVTAFTFARTDTGTFLEGTFGAYDRINYGIESFFVQEGTGKVYEDAVRERKLSAEIAIDDYGHATLKRLVVE